MSAIITRPSGAGGWVYCHGKPTMEAGFADTSSKEADEGTFAHEVAAKLLITGEVLPGASAEMLNHVQVYIDDIKNTMASIDNTLLSVEESVSIPRIQSDGTPDSWCLDINNRILYIWDLKYGWGLVEVFENWQLICYVIGILNSLAGNLEQQLTICMRIVQPRPYHEDGPIREWRFPATDLRAYANKLEHAAALARSADPLIKTGSWCRDCLALYSCKNAVAAGMNAVDVIGKISINICDPAGIGQTLTILSRAKELVNQLETAFKAQGLEAIKKGGSVPGWMASSGVGSLEWDTPDDQIFALGELMDIDLKKPTAPITPTQAIAKKMPEDMIKTLSKRKKATVTIKPDTGKIQKIFKEN